MTNSTMKFHKTAFHFTFVVALFLILYNCTTPSFMCNVPTQSQSGSENNLALSLLLTKAPCNKKGNWTVPSAYINMCDQRAYDAITRLASTAVDAAISDHKSLHDGMTPAERFQVLKKSSRYADTGYFEMHRVDDDCDLIPSMLDSGEQGCGHGCRASANSRMCYQRWRRC